MNISVNVKNILRQFYVKKETTKTAACRCSSKKVFLKFSQISQENTCANVSFQ